jgi:DNA-binding transcriptional MerR regulator
MFKIGDFSRIGQVSVRMLRHYDKLGLLTPSYTDPSSGYRYYTIDQLARLHRIVALNDLGLTLAQIAGLLQADGGLPLDQLRGMLVVREAQLEQELREKQLQLASVAARLAQLEQEGRASPYEIVVKPLAPGAVAGIRQLVPSVGQMGDFCRMMYEQLYAGLARHRVGPLDDEITFYHNQEYVDADLDVETAVLLDKRAIEHAPADERIAFRELPGADLAAALVYEGAYAGVAAAVLALLTWIGQHDHMVAGPLRELHRSGPAHVGGRLQEPAVIELQAPIAPIITP